MGIFSQKVVQVLVCLQKVQQVKNLFTESFTSSLTVISQLGINGVPQSPTISL